MPDSEPFFDGMTQTELIREKGVDHAIEPPSDLPVLPEKTLQAAQNWIKAHPEFHRPYNKEKVKGKEVWKDAKGETVKRDLERERKEIGRFLENIASENPDHYKTLERLSQLIAPMDPSTRVVVNVPALHEARHLYSLLDMYTKQVDEGGNPLDPNLYEINIIVNRKFGDAPDGSVDEIERFKQDLGEKWEKFQINYIDVEFHPPFNNVGNARRVITNLTLFRALQRPTQAGHLYIESEDADLENIDPKTVINVITKLDENPHLDAVLGIQDRLPDKMMKNDYLLLYRRMADFRKSIVARPKYRIDNNPTGNFMWNRTFTGGWNTAYTAEAYTLTGGYDERMTEMEDLMMGLRMSMARGNGEMPNTDVIGRVPTRTDSSPRRYIYALALDVGTKNLSYGDPLMNQVIREETLDQLLARIEYVARISPENLSYFETMVNRHYSFIKRATPSPEDAKEAMELLMYFSGFKKPNPDTGETGDFAFTEDGKVKIVHIDNIAEVLQKYRDNHTRMRAQGERVRHKNI